MAAGVMGLFGIGKGSAVSTSSCWLLAAGCCCFCFLSENVNTRGLIWLLVGSSHLISPAFVKMHLMSKNSNLDMIFNCLRPKVFQNVYNFC